MKNYENRGSTALVRSTSTKLCAQLNRSNLKRSSSVQYVRGSPSPPTFSRPGSMCRSSSQMISSHSRQIIFSCTTDPVTKCEVTLLKRSLVVNILRRLELQIAKPVAKRFNLRYTFIGELHPNAPKAGMTYREKVLSWIPSSSITDDSPTFRYIIRIRIRSRSCPEKKMLSFGTHLAVLLHELAHLRHMNHSFEFAKFLRDIYAFAKTELGVFDNPRSAINEFPSPWEWERAIWDSRGDISDDHLCTLHYSWIAGKSISV